MKEADGHQKSLSAAVCLCGVSSYPDRSAVRPEAESKVMLAALLAHRIAYHTGFADPAIACFIDLTMNPQRGLRRIGQGFDPAGVSKTTGGGLGALC